MSKTALEGYLGGRALFVDPHILLVPIAIYSFGPFSVAAGMQIQRRMQAGEFGRGGA